MTRATAGIRNILSSAAVYELFQRVLGAHDVRSRFVNDFIRPRPGMRVLDIGCGPAEILAYLPEVDYQGFDISPEYIERARKHFGGRGQFHCRELSRLDVEQQAPFDIVLMIGVLHHLHDEAATGVLRLVGQALKPGGRLLTMDPCLEPGQHPIARFLVRNDRGQYVRVRSGYAALGAAVFESPRVEVRHKKGIPYTHCLMECTRA